MENNFVDKQGYIGFIARIRQINDKLMYSGRKIYGELGLDIEPNWHLVLLLLKQERALSVTEIAKELQFSHPAVIKITKKMVEKGYLKQKPDKHDNRKTLLLLSPKAKREMPKLERQWRIIGDVIAKLVPPTFLKELSKVEQKLRNHDLATYVLAECNTRKY